MEWLAFLRLEALMNQVKPKIKCAIYCRKSSEEGLGQSFSSLDAQREACLSYVGAQRHEGWIALDDRYDDGGVSGGTLERPALKRLIRDIEGGGVDTVVCYKIDRLSRSLSDFVRLIEVFERHEVTFVSVTQSFNTTSSMGRLTLNVLLSFGQFEREVAGERIRDKFLQSRKRGMWMGGHPPLGYDVRDRKLVLNPAEAALVKHIFARFLQVGSATKLVQELTIEGHRTKRGKPFDKTVLYKLLRNRTYIGEVEHKGVAYPGQHQAVVARDTWEKVPAILSENAHHRASRTRATTPALLKGLIVGPDGQVMAPSHTRAAAGCIGSTAPRPPSSSGTPPVRSGACPPATSRPP